MDVGRDDGTMTLGAASMGARAAHSLDDVMRTRPLVSQLRNLELFADNDRFIKLLVDDIDNAKHHVGAWMFSWQDDGAGIAVRDALLRAVRRGVDVDVVVDGVGSRQFPFTSNRGFITELEKEGASVARAWPMRREGLRLERAGHDHMKLFEIDGVRAWTGGRNLADKYDLWHDYMVRFDGPAAAVLGAEHAARMRELSGTVSDARMDRLRHAWNMQRNADGLEGVTLLRTDPLRGRTEARDELFRRVANADSDAIITTPYFGSDEAAELLTEAAGRGVRVKVGVPGPNQWKNGQYAIHATRSYYPSLEGVRVLEFPFMSHAKANVIDGAGMVGTVNVGKRALVLDQELMLAFEPGSPASRTIQRQLLQDLAEAAPPPAGAGDARLPSIVRRVRGITGFEQ
jgi:cardiolipin synthase A/B